MTITRREKYQNGVLVLTEEFDSGANNGQGSYYTISSSTTSPSKTPTLDSRDSLYLPDWDGWAIAMNTNTAYNNAITNIVNTLVNNRTVARYENVLDILRFTEATSRDRRTWLSLIARWNDIPAIVPVINKPTAIQISVWNVICNNNFTPFTFDTSTVAMVLRSGF